MCMCVSACVCLHVCVCMCVRACVHACVHAGICVSVFKCVRMRVCACMHMCVRACVRVCVYACVYTHMCVCVHALACAQMHFFQVKMLREACEHSDGLLSDTTKLLEEAHAALLAQVRQRCLAMLVAQYV